MEFSQAFKNLKIDSLKIKEEADLLNRILHYKHKNILNEINKSIKNLESIAKKLKLESKKISIESKQIENELKEAKEQLNQHDFIDLLSRNTINSQLANKELATLLVLEKPVIELKGIIAKKIKSKYLPIESWDEDKIVKEFLDLNKYPKNKDIFSKLPKEYKPKSISKKREDVIKKIISIVKKTKSGYIMEKV